MMAIEPLHKTLVTPGFEDIFRYVQYDSIRITISKATFDANLRQLARLGIHPGTPIDRAKVETLFQANLIDCTGSRYDAILTNGQYETLVRYLSCGDFYYRNQGNADDAEYVLAFSFGERATVNSQIRFDIEQTFGTKPNPPAIYAQWEIADMVPFGPGTHLTFNRIGLDPGKDYITTREVIQKFRQMTRSDAGAKVFLACQAWHAPRCWRYCEEAQVSVVGGVFADLFSPNDPQWWVRDELSWVIKES
jgi:hypothetical protein